jgi:hypothetical protein
MTSCCFFVSLSSLCFATDEDGRAVENFCNTLFKCINYNLHEEMFCFNEMNDIEKSGNSPNIFDRHHRGNSHAVNFRMK